MEVGGLILPGGREQPSSPCFTRRKERAARERPRSVNPPQPHLPYTDSFVLLCASAHSGDLRHAGACIAYSHSQIPKMVVLELK